MTVHAADWRWRVVGSTYLLLTASALVVILGPAGPGGLLAAVAVVLVVVLWRMARKPVLHVSSSTLSVDPDRVLLAQRRKWLALPGRRPPRLVPLHIHLEYVDDFHVEDDEMVVHMERGVSHRIPLAGISLSDRDALVAHLVERIDAVRERMAASRSGGPAAETALRPAAPRRSGEVFRLRCINGPLVVLLLSQTLIYGVGALFRPARSPVPWLLVAALFAWAAWHLRWRELLVLGEHSLRGRQPGSGGGPRSAFVDGFRNRMGAVALDRVEDFHLDELDLVLHCVEGPVRFTLVGASREQRGRLEQRLRERLLRREREREAPTAGAPR